MAPGQSTSIDVFLKPFDFDPRNEPEHALLIRWVEREVSQGEGRVEVLTFPPYRMGKKRGELKGVGGRMMIRTGLPHQMGAKEGELAGVGGVGWKKK